MAVDALEGDLSGDKFPEALERTAGEGAGIVEAARGTLIHHYTTDDEGLITQANIIVATIQNNPAMEMVIRAHDPCLSCATHTMDSQMRLATVEVYDNEGNMIKKI